MRKQSDTSKLKDFLQNNWPRIFLKCQCHEGIEKKRKKKHWEGVVLDQKRLKRYNTMCDL